MIIPLLRSDPSHVRQIRSVLTNLALEGVALALTDGESLPVSARKSGLAPVVDGFGCSLQRGGGRTKGEPAK
jgi:hypothetical protein